jgi:hypothetical protein
MNAPEAEDRRERALALIRQLRYGRLPDEESGRAMEELERVIPHPAWPDLLFHTSPELSDEDAIDVALSYRPFAL